MGLPLANIVGGPLSGGLLELDGVAGLAGYQWLFMVEGVIAVLVGIVAVFYLTDRPEKAAWMPDAERDALLARLEADNADRAAVGGHQGWAKALLNPRVLYFCLICLCIQAAVYGLTFFLPTQVASITGRDVGFQVGLLTSIPWACAFVTIAVLPRFADRSGKHREIGAALLVLSGIGIAVSAVAENAVVAIIALCVAAIGFVTCQPLFWTLPTRYLSGAALAAGSVSSTVWATSAGSSPRTSASGPRRRSTPPPRGCSPWRGWPSWGHCSCWARGSCAPPPPTTPRPRPTPSADPTTPQETTMEFPARRTAVVTGVGAPRGIGRVVARRLARTAGASASSTSPRPGSRRSPAN